MNKKQLDREQAQHAYDEILSRFMRATRPRDRKRLALALDIAFERIPPDSPREKIRKARDASLAVKHMTLAGQRPAILHALTKANVEPFFRDIAILPELFADTEIMETTLVVWMLNRLSKNARGDTARTNLQRMAKILTNTYGPPAYETKEEREEARRAHERARSADYYEREKKKKPPE